MCGDHHPCSSRADTCASGTNDGGIHDATCKCGEIDECLWDEICQYGKCLSIEMEETSPKSSIEDAEDSNDSVEGSGCKYIFVTKIPYNTSIQIFRLKRFDSLSQVFQFNVGKIKMECRNDEFQCNDGECISNDYKCDKIQDCSSAEDELPPTCPCNEEKEFACKNGKQCINIHAKCDKHKDCLDGSDEDPAVCSEI